MRYFKSELPKGGTFYPEGCISYYEYDGDYNIRNVDIINRQWSYASENYRRDYLADQPLSESEEHPMPSWVHEISAEEFERVWDEALKRSSTK